MTSAAVLASHLLRLPSMSLLDRVIARLLARAPSPIVVRSRYGFLMSVGGDEFGADHVRARVATGQYERGHLRLLAALLDADSVVVDVGANEGYVSLYLSALLNAGGRVLAIEPHPANVARLEAGLRLNQRTNVTVVPRAVSDCPGTLTLHSDGAWATVLDGVYPSAPTVEVETTTLDDLARSGIDLTGLRLVKIDVEGHELQVVCGGQETLRKHRPVVSFEVNLTLLAYASYSVQELFDFFLDNDFRLLMEEEGKLIEFDSFRMRTMDFVAVPSELMPMCAERQLLAAPRVRA